mgnify:CR=1 FL=1|jgi:hypothetical protein
MKCPSCNIKVGIFKNPVLWIKLGLKKVMPCPYCNIDVYKKKNTTWEYFEQFLFVIFWFGVLLFLMAIIFSRHIGFESALKTCFWLWLIVIVVFSVILLLNLILILFYKIYARFGQGKNDS